MLFCRGRKEMYQKFWRRCSAIVLFINFFCSVTRCRCHIFIQRGLWYKITFITIFYVNGVIREIWNSDDRAVKSTGWRLYICQKNSFSISYLPKSSYNLSSRQVCMFNFQCNVLNQQSPDFRLLLRGLIIL